MQYWLIVCSVVNIKIFLAYSHKSEIVPLYRNSCCTTPCVGIGGGLSKMLSFTLKFLCDGIGSVRWALVCADKSCVNYVYIFSKVCEFRQPSDMKAIFSYLPITEEPTSDQELLAACKDVIKYSVKSSEFHFIAYTYSLSLRYFILTKTQYSV